MPPAIALPELDASACMSFARACIKPWLMRLCALLCLRTLDLRQPSAFQLWRRDGCRHLPQVIGPEGLAFCASAFQRGCLFCVDAHGMEAAALFCYCELVFYSLKVIFGPAHMYALGCVYLMRSELLSTRVRRSRSVSVWICVIQRVSFGCYIWVAATIVPVKTWIANHNFDSRSCP